MNYQNDIDYQNYECGGTFAAQAAVSERASFIAKTYVHLAGAIGLFVLIEAVLLSMPFARQFTQLILQVGQFGWLIVLGAFMLVSMVAERWARSSTSLGVQYAGLGLYVVAEAVIFVPILYIASQRAQGVIAPAAATTLGLFAIMTAIVFVTRKNFSFMRSALCFGGIAALGFIVISAVCGFNMPIFFMYFMIALACGYILYHTSNVLHEYHTTQYVAASLALFASVALLFWYILQLFMSRE